MALEERFHEEMLRIYREATEFDYYATYLLRMVNEQGGLTAAKQLLRGDSPPADLRGFGKNSDSTFRWRPWYSTSLGGPCLRTKNWLKHGGAWKN